MTAPEDSRERLSRAMGAAFLAHQVSELERSVDNITFSRDARLYDIGRGGRAGSRNGPGGKREVRVVDASALVHALPVLKRWIREDTYLLIVPLEAISTLDALKKAPNPLHDLARDATRFLETQLNIARQIESDGTFARTEKHEHDPRIRLRAQAKGEEMAWEEVEKSWKVPEDYEYPPPPPAPAGREDEEVPEPVPPTANDIPRQIRSTLRCALYFQQKYPKNPSLAVHRISPDLPIPPPSALPPLPTMRGAPAPPTDFLALSSGDTVWHYLSTFFGVEAQCILTSEIVAAREWLKAQALAQAAAREAASASAGSGGRGAGSGRGGRGRGGGGRASSHGERGGRSGRGSGRGEEGGGRGRGGGRHGAAGGGAGSSAGGGGVLFVP